MPLQEVTSAKQLDELVAAHPEALFVLDFWASWCEPCKQMNDVVAQLSKTHTAVYFIKVPSSRRLSIDRTTTTSLATCTRRSKQRRSMSWRTDTACAPCRPSRSVAYVRASERGRRPLVNLRSRSISASSYRLERHSTRSVAPMRLPSLASLNGTYKPEAGAALPT